MPEVLIIVEQYREGHTDLYQEQRRLECETTEQLFRKLVHDYGRCTGKLYSGLTDIAHGWKFRHRRDGDPATLTEVRLHNPKVVSACKVPWYDL
jgi:hypothetical protein